jgi:hypothetical protein
VDAMEPTSQLLLHVVVVRRHVVWLSCVSVSTCFLNAVTSDPSRPSSVAVPIDNNSRRGHTTVGASKNNNGAQGSMRVQLQRRMCFWRPVQCLNSRIGAGMFVSAVGQCPAAVCF